MADKSSWLSENLSEAHMTSDVALLDEMRCLVREASAPAEPGERVAAAIQRAARRLGMSFARAKAHWYGEARSVPAAEWIAAQQAKRALLKTRRDQLLREIELLERRLTDDDIPAMAMDSRSPRVERHLDHVLSPR